MARRSQVRVAPWVLAVGGTAAVCAYLLAQARITLNGKVTPLWNWWGLSNQLSSATARGWMALISAVALVAWFACWWGLLTRAGRLRPRTLALAALGWGVPFVVGPPLLSLDAYAYIAQGRMVQLGLNPYRLGPIALGHGRILAAVDPLWRHTPTPYGPLLLRVQAGTVQLAGRHPVLAIFEFRALVAIALAGTAWLAARALARPVDRARALLLVPLNPVLLVYLLNGAHLDALMAVLVLASLVAARSGRVRLGLVVAAVAVALKMPAVVAVAAIGMADLHGRSGRSLLRRAAEDSALVGAVLLACSFAVPDGFGWLTALGTPAKVSAGYAPAELFAGLVHLVLLPFGVHAMSAELLAVRVLFATGGAALVAWLCFTVGRRGQVATAVLGLLVVAVAAPVLYGWYLAWGLLPAVLLVDRRWGRRLVLAASAVGLIGLVPNLGLLTDAERHLLAGIFAAPALVAVVVWSLARRPRGAAVLRAGSAGRALIGGFARRRLPRWALGALVAAGALSVMSAPAVAVPGSVRQTAQLLTGKPSIAHAWLIGTDYYVLLPAVPVPEQTSETPIVIASDGGAVVNRCPVGPMPAVAALPADSSGSPAVVYQVGGGACWRPAPAAGTG